MGCTISKGLTVGQLEQYFNTHFTIGNYYAEREGEWQGKLAEKYGLIGAAIDKQVFDKVIRGQNPEGQQVVQPGPNGEHRAGFDITFTSPKDITILHVNGATWALDAHKHAVTASLNWAEKYMAQARVTVDGETKTEYTGNLLVAKFLDFDSRPVNGFVAPNIHTHAVIMNQSERSDGQIRALSNELFKLDKSDLNFIYDSFVAAYAEKHGATIQWFKYIDQHGKEQFSFTVAGIPEELRKMYSPRNDQIQQIIKDHGIKSSEALKNAALVEREAKITIDPQQWKAEVMAKQAALGWTPERVTQSYKQATEEKKANERETARLAKENPLTEERKVVTPEQYTRYAVTDTLERESVFRESKIIVNAMKLSVIDSGYQRTPEVETYKQEFATLEKGRELKYVGEKTVQVKAGNGGHVNVAHEYYSTPGMIRAEQQLVDWVKEGKNTMEPIMTPEEATAHITKCEAEKAKEFKEKNPLAEKPFQFTADQRNALNTILTTRDATLFMEGHAGTGKTTIADVLRQAAEAKGMHIYGVSTQGKAVAKLEQESGVKSYTNQAFQGAIGRGEIDPSRAIVIHDEASRAGTKDTYLLQQWAREHQVQLLHSGNFDQLAAIAAGNPYEFQQKLAAPTIVTLTETMRFKTDHAREVAADMQARRTDAAYDKLEKAGKLHEFKVADYGSPKEALEALKAAAVKDFVEKDHIKNIMVTGYNLDRRDMNSRIRAAFQEKGVVAKEQYEVEVRNPKNLSPTQMRDSSSYDNGDSVFVRDNIPGFVKGDTAKVIGTNIENNTISLYYHGGVRDLPVGKWGPNLSAHVTAAIPVAEGDKMIFLKNDTLLNVKNGDLGIVKKINEHGDVSLKILGEKEPRTVDFNLVQYNYMDHGYVLTIAKVQGESVQSTIWFVPTGAVQGKLQGSVVATTRGQYGTAIYTMDVEKLKAEMREPILKMVTLDFKDVNSIQGEKLVDFIKTVRAEQVVMHFQDKYDVRTNPDPEIKISDLDFKLDKKTGDIIIKEDGKEFYRGPREMLFDHTQREVLTELRNDCLLRDMKGMAREIDKVLGPEPKDNFLNLEPLRVSIKDHGLRDETHPGILKDHAEGMGRDWGEVLEEIRNDVNYVPPIAIENSDSFEKTKADLWADRDRRVEQNRDSDRDTDKEKDGDRDKESDRDWTRDF